MLCTLGMTVMVFGLFSLSRLSPTNSAFHIVWCLALVGIGTAIFASPNSSAVMSAVYHSRRGVAAGTISTARNSGVVVGVALAELIFNSIFRSLSGGLSLKVYQPELEPIFMAAFRYAMLAGSLVAGIGVIVAFLRGSEQVRFEDG